jgi:DNA mismatch endonuclease (patch repair protein)
VPKSNVDFWKQKFRDNRQRDARAILRLRKSGYRVVVIWECQSDHIRSKLRKILEPSRVDP